MKLLIVEDSLVIVASLFNLLSNKENIESIYYATTYNEAVSFFSLVIPDIILLDINLRIGQEEKNGIDLLRYVKQHNYPSKVMIVTNEVNSCYRELCKELGADYFIDKSMEFEHIPEIIARL